MMRGKALIFICIAILVMFVLNIALASALEITSPKVNEGASIKINKGAIMIEGNAVPSSKVDITVNGALQKSFTPEEIPDGKFNYEAKLDSGALVINSIIIKSELDGVSQEKIFSVQVDSQPPIVSIQTDGIPRAISSNRIEINGNSNEPVKITAVTSRIAPPNSNPPKILGLKSALNEAGKPLRIEWQAVEIKSDGDFAHYVVYRNDAPIELIASPSFPQYSDVFISPSAEYKYRISLVNNYGAEGEKSDELAVKTPPGILAEVQEPQRVDILEGINARQDRTFNNFPIALSFDDDGEYNIEITAEDEAGNSIPKIERTIKVDTKELRIEGVSPRDNSFFYDSLTNKIDIKGKTKPFAKVYLFMNKKESFDINPELASSLDNSANNFVGNSRTFEILEDGLPDSIKEFRNLKEEDFQGDVRCQSGQCTLKYAETAVADREGNFVFSKVDLTPIFSFGASFRNAPLSASESSSISQNNEREASMVLIAVDNANSRYAYNLNLRMGTCWSSSAAPSFSVSKIHQDPFALSPERIAESIEEIYVYLRLEPFNPSQKHRIENIYVSNACADRSIESSTPDKRFERGCALIPKSKNRAILLNDGKTAYFRIKLNSEPEMEKWSDEDWKKWYKELDNTVNFPLKVDVVYSADINNNGLQNGRDFESGEDLNGNGFLDAGEDKNKNGILDFPETHLSQTSCQEISYSIDDVLINTKKLPDWLLVDTPNVLEDASKKLEDADEKLEKASKFALKGCIVSYGSYIGSQILRRISSNVDEFRLKASGLGVDKILSLGQGNNAISEEDKPYCGQLIEKLRKDGKGLDGVRDADLKRCFKASYSGWSLESKMYSLYRASCDRIFGHAAPASWTADKESSEISKKLESNNECSSDQSVLGLNLKAEKCADLAKYFTKSGLPSFSPEDKCFLIRKSEGTGETLNLYQLGDREDGRVYHIQTIETPSKLSIDYAVKIDDKNYITSQQKSCREICGDAVKSSTGKKLEKDERGGFYTFGADKKRVEGECLPLTECRQLMSESKSPLTSRAPFRFLDGTTASTYTAFSKGFTDDCFYDGNPKSVSSNPNERNECCCVVEGQVEPKERGYFEPSDEIAVDTFGTRMPLHESKTSENIYPTGFEDMKFSYRYFKEGFEIAGVKKNYNPLRYIDGRDKYACFGLNNIFLPKDKKEESIQLNPFTQHTAAFQCVYLTGIRQRLNAIKAVMDSTRSCLIEVKKTGRGSSGNCREIFSQRMCGLIWQIAGYFADNCGSYGDGSSLNADSDERLGPGALENFYKSARDTFTSSKSGFESEYPTALLTSNSIFGAGANSISRRICMAAFGTPFDPNAFLDETLEISAKSPYASNAYSISSKRTYLTVDPLTLQPSYEYRAGLYINPGCDISSFTIEASCVGQNEIGKYSNQIDCTKVGGFDGGGCNCYGLPSEEKRIMGGYSNYGQALKQSVPQSIAVKENIIAPYRFDHIKITLRPDYRISPNVRKSCFNDGYTDEAGNGVFYFPIKTVMGQDLLECNIAGGGTGLIDCSKSKFLPNLLQFGPATFNSLSVNNVDVLSQNFLNHVISVERNKPVELKTTIINPSGQKCMKLLVGTKIINEYNIPEGTAIIGNDEGLSFSSRELEDAPVEGQDIIGINIKAKVISRNSGESVSIKIKFIDGGDNPDGNIELTSNSADSISIDGQTKIEINNINTVHQKLGGAEIFRENANELYITKNGAKILLQSATLPVITGSPNKQKDVEESLTILPQSPQTASKQVTLQVFNLDNNGNCDINNPARISAAQGAAKTEVSFSAQLINSVVVAK